MSVIFKSKIKEIEQELLIMGKMVIDACIKSVNALEKKDLLKAKEVIKEDELINEKQFDIENKCISLIATQHPLVSQLREIIAIIYIISELERIGDYAEGIGKIVLMLGENSFVNIPDELKLMSKKAVKMIYESLDSLMERNIKKAKLLYKKDDEVDELYSDVYNKLLLTMIKKPEHITIHTYYIWIAHNLERMADRTTNISERVIYLVTGEHNEEMVSKY